MAGGLAWGNKKKKEKKKMGPAQATVSLLIIQKNSNGFKWICLNDGLPLLK
jgi:hypothetical protein